jgi:hypothetical protein
MSAGVWKVAGTSAVGASHNKTGRPCEDSHAIKFIEGENEWLITCISDGAGSASKGREGAVYVCKHFVEYVEKCVKAGMTIECLSRESVSEWIADCHSSLKSWVSEDASIKDYSATFLGAVVHGNTGVFIQIGDGAIVLSGVNSQSYFPVFWPEQGEYANQTVFVTSEEAQDSLLFKQEALEFNVDFALFSDGLQRLCLHYATKSAHQPFFNYFFSELRHQPSGLSESMSGMIEEFLLSPAVLDRTDDDKTLVVATRRATEDGPI